MDYTHHISIARRLARLMDSQFKIFNVRFGLDPLIGLIPGIGDAVSFALGLYIIWIAVSARLPSSAIMHMIINLVFDLTVGAIPVVGDITDVFYKANLKNLDILTEHTARIEEGQVIS